MDDPEPTLLLTRPEPQSRDFLAACEARVGYRLPVIVSPLLQIEPVGDLPDLDRYRTVILTSANAVERFGAALAGRTVVTVGARTAERAAEFGASATCLGENVEAFLVNLPGVEGPALHAHGRHTRGDLAARARAAGLSVEEAEIYDQVSQPLSRAAREALQKGPVIAPVFSPRTARLLSAYPVAETCTILALSPAVAANWTGGGTVKVAERPDRAAMIEAVARAF